MLYSRTMKTVKQKMKKELKITSALWKSALCHVPASRGGLQQTLSDTIAEPGIPMFVNNFQGLHFPHKQNDIPALSPIRYMRWAA